MFLENGTSTLNCFISPTDVSRKQAKKIIGDRFRLIYVKASAEEVRKRDVKGLIVLFLYAGNIPLNHCCEDDKR